MRMRGGERSPNPREVEFREPVRLAIFASPVPDIELASVAAPGEHLVVGSPTRKGTGGAANRSTLAKRRLVGGDTHNCDYQPKRARKSRLSIDRARRPWRGGWGMATQRIAEATTIVAGRRRTVPS